MDTRIVVNHLTRMRETRICVAGLTRDGRTLRPQRYGPWTRDRHLVPAGPFEIGAVVDLGPTRPMGHPPEVEDTLVLDESRVRAIGRLRDEAFWQLQRSHARPTLRQIFGPELVATPTGRACVPGGSGTASLGVLACRWARITVEWGRPRVVIADPDLGQLNLSLTDIRVHDHAHRPVPELVRLVQRRLRDGNEFLLAVGLTRPFAPSGSSEASHWLQVNNVHFPDYYDDHPVFAGVPAS